MIDLAFSASRPFTENYNINSPDIVAKILTKYFLPIPLRVKWTEAESEADTETDPHKCVLSPAVHNIA